jgi:hypothetical protein
MTPSRWSRRRAGGVLLLPIVLSAVAALVIDVREAGDRPEDTDIDVAVSTVRKAIGPADAIVVAPPWSMRPLKSLGPLAERALPADGPWDQLVHNRFAHVFVIAEPDAAPWLDRPLLQQARSLGHHGSVDVLVLDGAAARFDGRARFDDAVVTLHTATDDGVCAPNHRGNRHGRRCAGGLRVGREWALVTENGADVIVASPPPQGQVLEVAWADVDVADHLVIAAGHARLAAERADPIAGTVTLTVRLDDDVVATIQRQPSFFVEPHRRALKGVFVGEHGSVPDDERGFRVDTIDTRAHRGQHRLSVSITTDDASNNAFAFDVFVPGTP